MDPSTENNPLPRTPKEQRSKPHIVLPLLLVIIIAGYFIVYLINHANDKTLVSNVATSKSGQLSNKELATIAEMLNKSSSSSPPMKPAELKSVAEYLNRQSEKQKPLTNQELQRIAEVLNK